MNLHEKVRLMDISNEEVLNIWGRKLLKDRGYMVSEKAKISVELGTEGEGCCDECWIETPVTIISVISKNREERASVKIQDYEFDKALLELVEISRNL